MFVAFRSIPCPRTCTHTICTPTNVHTIICLTLKLSRTCYQWNYVPTNQDHFGYPRTLTPRNKNVFLKYICVFFLSISQFFPTLNYISRNSAAKIYTYRNIFNEQTFCFWHQETPIGCFIIFWLFFFNSTHDALLLKMTMFWVPDI